MATQGTKITDLNPLTTVAGNLVVPVVDPTISLAYPNGRTLQTTVNDIMILTVTTTVNLTNKNNTVNTTGKVQGKMVFNSTNNLIYVAGGSTNTSNWYPSDGGSAITPA